MGIASCPLVRKSRRPAAEAAGRGDKARRAAGGPEAMGYASFLYADKPVSRTRAEVGRPVPGCKSPEPDMPG